MKTTFAIFSLFAAAFAAPAIQSRQATQFPTVTFQVSNDADGPQATGNIIANGVAVRLGDIFGNTGLVQNGRVIATSAQLTANFQNTFCIFNDAAGAFVDIANEQKTFANLDRNVEAAVRTDVTDFTFLCEV